LPKSLHLAFLALTYTNKRAPPFSGGQTFASPFPNPFHPLDTPMFWHRLRFHSFFITSKRFLKNKRFEYKALNKPQKVKKDYRRFFTQSRPLPRS